MKPFQPETILDIHSELGIAAALDALGEFAMASVYEDAEKTMNEAAPGIRFSDRPFEEQKRLSAASCVRAWAFEVVKAHWNRKISSPIKQA